MAPGATEIIWQPPRGRWFFSFPDQNLQSQMTSRLHQHVHANFPFSHENVPPTTARWFLENKIVVANHSSDAMASAASSRGNRDLALVER
jgi:hypothetical protein